MRSFLFSFCLVLVPATLVAPGCERRSMQPAAAKPPVVPVSQPVRRQVTDYMDYTGRLDAVQSLDVRARVTGYLIRMPFKEGSEVKKGDLLFEIDPRPYQAQFDAANAQVALSEANYKLARAENARSKVIARRDPGAISAEDLERYSAQEAQALAALGVAKANLESAQLYLSFTRVEAPIDGIVSRFFYTLGNLVNQDQTLLTTIVSYEPMWAYFDVEERVVLRVRKMINAGEIKVPADRTNIPVFMGLEGEEGFPHQGTLDFVNNIVNPSTGTLAARGVFANPLPPGGRRLLTPGMFVRIRLPIGPAHEALLVIDRAIQSDQGLMYVYVVDKDDTVRYQRITTGSLQEDGLRVIQSGLTPDDWVVVGALQQVRPKMKIEREPIAMPSLAQPAEEVVPPPAPAPAKAQPEPAKAQPPAEPKPAAEPHPPAKAQPAPGAEKNADDKR